MARAPDKRIEQAKKMYLQGKKLVDIAEALGLPEGTVRRWKCTHKWDNERSDKKANVRKRGAQPGNRNSAGGPPGNKKALKTGEFETLFFDALDPDERKLISVMPSEKEQLLLQEIQLLTVRERRMMRRTDDINKSDGSHEDGAGDIPADMTLVKLQSGIDKDKGTNLKEYHGKLDQIQAIEDALTRVQARKQKAIDSLHRFGFDDTRLEIELLRLDLTALKLGGQDTEIEDDGFLDALNAEAGSLWEKTDENE